MKARLEKLDPAKNIARYYHVSVLPNLFEEWTLRRECQTNGNPLNYAKLDYYECHLYMS